MSTQQAEPSRLGARRVNDRHPVEGSPPNLRQFPEEQLDLTKNTLASMHRLCRTDISDHRTKNTRRATTVSEHPGFTPSSPVTSLSLKLSSAIITADGSRSRDLGRDRLLRLKLSISARVLGGFDILLATTDKSRESAANSREEISTAERLELHINPILLSSVPRLIHLSGRSLSAHHDDAAVRSYTLTLTFSDGSATAKLWSTTFEVPRSPLVNSRWHLTVPFSHSLTPPAPPCTP